MIKRIEVFIDDLSKEKRESRDNSWNRKVKLIIKIILYNLLTNIMEPRKIEQKKRELLISHFSPFFFAN